jgi:hypothetical protein
MRALQGPTDQSIVGVVREHRMQYVDLHEGVRFSLDADDTG